MGLWYIFVILGVIFHSFERIIDKKLVVRKKGLDPLTCAFIRNLCFYISILFIGIFGFFGKIEFFFSLIIVVWSFFHVIASITYDYLIKKNQVIKFEGITFLFSIFLIGIDKYFFEIDYSFLALIGALFLIYGGILVSKNKYSKKNKKVDYVNYLFFSYHFLISIIQVYIFKYNNITYGINEITHYTNTWFYVSLFFLLFMLIKKKHILFFKISKENNFFLKTLLSKFLDSISGLFMLKAISLSSVSKVHLFGSISPIIFFIIVLFLSKILKVDLEEDFNNKSLLRKLCGVIFLGIGSFLIII